MVSFIQLKKTDPNQTIRAKEYKTSGLHIQYRLLFSFQRDPKNELISDCLPWVSAPSLINPAIVLTLGHLMNGVTGLLVFSVCTNSYYPVFCFKNSCNK